MSFHLEGPWLSTTGKRKTKRKYRTAEQAKKARAATASWEELLKKHNVTNTKAKPTVSTNTLLTRPVYRGSDLPRIPSRETTWEPCTKAEIKVYTGTKMLGIATMHKSNSVPVFSEQEAKDISRMRRG